MQAGEDKSSVTMQRCNEFRPGKLAGKFHRAGNSKAIRQPPQPLRVRPGSHQWQGRRGKRPSNFSQRPDGQMRALPMNQAPREEKPRRCRLYPLAALRRAARRCNGQLDGSLGAPSSRQKAKALFRCYIDAFRGGKGCARDGIATLQQNSQVARQLADLAKARVTGTLPYEPQRVLVPPRLHVPPGW